MFHANPLIYKFSDKPNPFNKKITSKSIWENDKIKNDYIKSQGFDLLIIWESEYLKNKELTLKKCIEFLEG